ncbi:dipeptidase [Porticoccaceae bacterium]|nr:dipeptidase [Porticoccaceae bacterium]
MTKLSLPIMLLVLSQVGCSNQSNKAQNPSLLNHAQAIHSAALTIDAHADIEIPGKPSMYVGADGLSKVTPQKMQKGGVDAVVMSLAVGPMPRTPEGYSKAKTIALTKLAAVKALSEKPANNTLIAKTTDELLSAHSEGKSAIVLGFQNGLILGTDVNQIDALYHSGVRVFGLTHMGHNDFADSSRPLYNAATKKREPEAEHGGLSPLGRQAIAKINALGAIFDISQLSKQAALQAMALSSSPVIASHSNVRALTDVSRNLSDEELDHLSKTGGVIHIAPFRGYLFDSSNPEMDINIRAVRRQAGIEESYLYPFELYWEIQDAGIRKNFLTSVNALLGQIAVEQMVDHIDYVVKRIGVDHVGIGTDFNHGSGIEGFTDASDALNITLELVKRGYSEEDIKKIWGGNFMRVWRQAELAASGV